MTVTRRTTRNLARLAPAVAAPALLGLVLASPAAATDGTYQTELTQLNTSGARSTALVQIDGTTVTVSLTGSGFAPGQPHAQHLHGDLSGTDFTCPAPGELAGLDEDGDGLLSTVEAASKYGAVMISLTTTGDTSMDSGLAVDRFPVADENGDLTYNRTFEVDRETADGLENLHLVQHGIDLDDSGEYDGEARSSLDPNLPLEATIPAVCGAFGPAQTAALPQGGVQTGDGSPDTGRALAFGGLALAAGAAAIGAGALGRRRTATPTR